MTERDQGDAEAPPGDAEVPPAEAEAGRAPALAGPPGMAGGAPGAAWTLRGLLRAASIAAFAFGVGAGLGYLIAHEPAPPPGRDGGGTPRPRPAGAAERALLAPLREGSPLGDFEVKSIGAVNEQGVLRVVCAGDRAEVRLDIALLADDGPEPPAVAGRYAIFYSLKNATPEDGERLAAALAAVLNANAAAPIPPGLAPFTPAPKRLTPI